MLVIFSRTRWCWRWATGLLVSHWLGAVYLLIKGIFVDELLKQIAGDFDKGLTILTFLGWAIPQVLMCIALVGARAESRAEAMEEIQSLPESDDESPS